eukprot:scaffold12701_cov40-Cyclotella_meneghiniana.AAC.4
MPSRKKAQGKARKAKQAAEAESNPSNGCDHIGEPNWSCDDYDAASLLNGYRCQCDELARGDDENFITEGIYNVAHFTYDKYQQLSDDGKKFFRRGLLAAGTTCCVDAAKKNDLTKVTTATFTAMTIVAMINAIEIRDKYSGPYDRNHLLQLQVSMNDITHCPRQTIRFFHRRNHCDCLQEIYYKLKETTNKTASCFSCRKVVAIKQLSRCHHCDVAQYCSYDCALAHWPKHKVYCKPTKTTKSSNDLEKVD